MDKSKQWAVGISCIVGFCDYRKFKDALEKEVYRLAGVQEPKFLAGMKYVIDIAETEFIKLKKGEYDRQD